VDDDAALSVPTYRAPAIFCGSPVDVDLMLDDPQLDDPQLDDPQLAGLQLAGLQAAVDLSVERHRAAEELLRASFRAPRKVPASSSAPDRTARVGELPVHRPRQRPTPDHRKREPTLPHPPQPTVTARLQQIDGEAAASRRRIAESAPVGEN